MTRLSLRRLLCTLALALSLGALMALAATPVLARKAACTSAHAKHGTRACAQSHHPRKHHARHARKNKRGKHVGGSGASNSAPAVVRVAPRCEDSGRSSSGASSCADGSEPACPAGSTPTLSSAGSILYCTKAAEAAFSEGASCEAGSSGECEVAASACENGKAPNTTSDGSFACTDGSEPRCADGSAPTLAADGQTLLCPIDASSEPGA